MLREACQTTSVAEETAFPGGFECSGRLPHRISEWCTRLWRRASRLKRLRFLSTNRSHASASRNQEQDFPHAHSGPDRSKWPS